MKYLLFQDPSRDYGAEFDVTKVGARKRGFGAYEAKDAKILKKLHGDLISEIPVEEYERLKKKLGSPAVSSRQLGVVAQDPSKNPNAVYAVTEVSEVPSKSAKDLVSVGNAKVENPLKGTK
tara:strand:- start:2005 stop:2367 length:363 start_codon:yes stop_codon:yes gene_type:complete